jgi:hypothetical protein
MTTLAPFVSTSLKGKIPMRTLAFNRLPPDEQEGFISSCRRWTRNPEEFLVKAEEYDPPPGAPSPSRRDVIVTHVPSGKARRYTAGHGSSWNAAFEDDLQAVFYSVS